MMKTEVKVSRVWRVLGWVAAYSLLAGAVNADWLVTRTGERIETDGGWQIKGRMVIFTAPGGTLSSLRASEVDLDASREATREAAEAAARPVAPVAPAAPAPRRRPARVITTEDVGAGVPGADGVDLLIQRLRQAHEFKDVGLAMGVVNWEGVPPGVRNYFQTQFEWMLEQRIRGVRFVEITPEELEEAQQAEIDDVLYEPNVELAGTIEMDFFPAPDQAESALVFQVGTRLGVYFIAAPREIPE